MITFEKLPDNSIDVLDDKLFIQPSRIGNIFPGEIRGEWLSEPINCEPKLIKGKKNAIKYITDNKPQ